MPSRPCFYFELGERLEDRRRFDDAEKLLQEGHRAAADAAGPAQQPGHALHAAGQGEGGAEAARKGLRGRPVQRPRLQHAQGARATSTNTRRSRPSTSSCASTRRTTASWPTSWPSTWKTIYDELAEKFNYQPDGADPGRGVQQPRDVQRPDRRPARPAHDRRLHGPDGGHGVAATARASRKPFNWGARAAARAGPHLQPGADQLPGAALAHRGAGRQQRGLPPAAAVERAAARARAGRRAVQPGHHQPGLHPAAIAADGSWPTARASSTSST